MKLSNATLPQLPPGVSGPAYDRSALKPGIVHIGLGNFHRAHQSWYMSQLFARGLDMDFAILGAGVRATDAQMRERLEAQDWLSTLVELGPEGTRAEVVGSMVGFVPVEEGHGPLIAAMSDPAIRIVTLTVTEGGYYVDPATQAFDQDHPDIRHDAENPQNPRTAFGAIVAALRARATREPAPSPARAATTFPAMATSCERPSPPWRASPTPPWPPGSMPTPPFPTPWWTASSRLPAPRSSPSCATFTASRTKPPSPTSPSSSG
jgi:hypothetical protein